LLRPSLAIWREGACSNFDDCPPPPPIDLGEQRPAPPPSIDPSVAEIQAVPQPSLRPQRLPIRPCPDLISFSGPTSTPPRRSSGHLCFTTDGVASFSTNTTSRSRTSFWRAPRNPVGCTRADARPRGDHANFWVPHSGTEDSSSRGLHRVALMYKWEADAGRACKRSRPDRQVSSCTRLLKANDLYAWILS
jgi:hypothetical protein